VAWRVPREVAQRRQERLRQRAQKSGRPASAAQLALCGWTVLVTTAPPERLSAHELSVLARVRWQVELLFKLWKSEGQLGASRGRRGDRVLCEVLAKLLGQLVQHWVLLTAGPWLDAASAVRRARRLRRLVPALARALGCREELTAVLQRIAELLRRLRPRGRRKKKPSTYELLKDPGRAGLG
jgi:Transposase DDE domain